MNTTPILGIDIAKTTLEVALLRDARYQNASFANSKDGLRRLRKWLKKHDARCCPIILEATGTYGDLAAKTAQQWGSPVYVVNPARVKAHRNSMGKQNKTDLEDAKVIAHFGSCHDLIPWTPPTPSQEALQAYTRRLETLKKNRVEEINRRKAGRLTKPVRKSIEKHIAFLDKQITDLEKAISEHIDEDPELREKRELLESIPSIGSTTAALFLAEVPDISRFASARALAAFAGLAPRQHLSGTSIKKQARLSKAGNFRLRSMLYMPAVNALRWNPLLKVFAERLKLKGKHNMVIIAAVMRKLLHLMFGVLKTKQPFDPNYLANLQDAT